MVILEKCAECAKVCVLETNRNICVREKIDQNSKTQQPCRFLNKVKLRRLVLGKIVLVPLNQIL